MSSIAPPPAYPTWPPQQPYPPAPQKPRRRWPAVAAAAAAGAIAAGLITTLITIAATPTPTPSAAPARPTVTETAGSPPAPAPLPAAQADAQTCHAWGTADKLVTAASVAQGVIPEGTDITSPAVQSNPAWKAGVIRASGLYAQAADTFDAQIAAGTTPMLAQVADTTVSALRTLAAAYEVFDPITANAVPTFQANQRALDWLCP